MTGFLVAVLARMRRGSFHVRRCLSSSLTQLRLNLRFQAFESSIKENRKSAEQETNGGQPDNAKLDCAQGTCCLLHVRDVAGSTHDPQRNSPTQTSSGL